MCNAYRHGSDCTCGFGPPYEKAEVKITNLPSPANNRTSVAAAYTIRFPVAAEIKAKRLNRAAAKRAQEAIRKLIQKVANNRFGSGKFRIEVTRIAIGSIDIDVVLLTGAGVAVFKFVKDYDQFKRNLTLLCKDIAKVSRSLKRVIRKAIIFESHGTAIKEVKARRKRTKKRNRYQHPI